MSASPVLAVGYDIANPTSAPTIAAGTATGLLDLSANYSYKVTYVTAFGESAPSVASNVVQTTTGSINLTGIPVSPNSNVTARNLYRVVGGGSTYLFLVSLPQSPSSAATTYTDIIVDASLGAAAPSVNTASSKQIVQGSLTATKPFCHSVSSGLTALAGGAQVGATALVSAYNFFSTVASGNDSSILPELTADNIGLFIVVRNNGANTMRVYPAVGETIDGGAADAPITVAAGASANLVAVSASAWLSC